MSFITIHINKYTLLLIYRAIILPLLLSLLKDTERDRERLGLTAWGVSGSLQIANRTPQAAPAKSLTSETGCLWQYPGPK